MSLCVPVWVCVHHVYAGADKDQQRESEALKVELQMLWMV